ncbi:hypothetical protein MYX06_03320 [Patescibacteria group bacterium AH-259-L05]|nr:hypothetical protein [Patescibacteria group bacterium AH-259-L05]
MGRIRISLVVLFLVSPLFLRAGENDSTVTGFTIHGFGFFTQSLPKEGDPQFGLVHLWLIATNPLNDNIDLTIILAPEGPPRLVHNLQLTWRKPIKGIDYLTVGKFIPAFGWEFSHYRIDLVPTVQYTVLVNSLVARSNGAEIGGTPLGWFEWKLGAFSGERVGGNINKADDGKWNIYPRLRLNPLRDRLWMGSTLRLGPVDAWGLDLQAELPLLPLRIEAETIATNGSIQHSILGVYRVLPWLHGVFRYEDLKEGKRFIPGLAIKLPYNNEIKLNAVISDEGFEVALLQGVLRW